MSFVYLASPYTPVAGESIQQRVDAACRAAAKLMEMGHAVFSPIAHSHYVADYLPDGLRLDHAFWMGQDIPVLREAKKMYILMLPGWEQSRGIAREIEVANARGIPIEHLPESFA